MATTRHLLVFRFSSMGDVAMTIPVIRLLLQQYPGIRITFVSNRFFQPMFTGIDRLDFFPADLKGKHKGITGLYRLYHELRKDQCIDAVADLHNVIRTKMLRLFFLLSSRPFARIDKGRSEKEALTRKENKVLRQLPSTFERYAAVFHQLGFTINLNGSLSSLPTSGSSPAELVEWRNQGYKLVGVAPFAQHPEKMYPVEKMKELLRMLQQVPKLRLLLFGGGKNEVNALQQWQVEFPGIRSMAGKMSLHDELSVISDLDLMVSMDSANMHLASLYNVPVVSIWGATHPFAGFYGWHQKEEHAAQIQLYCRPCSVFGNKTCYRGDLACLHELSPELIYQKIITALGISR